jgi:hypothetical protein
VLAANVKLPLISILNGLVGVTSVFAPVAPACY